MSDISTPQGQLDVIARLIARDAVAGALPSQSMIDLYWIRKDHVEAAAAANRARIVELQATLAQAI